MKIFTCFALVLTASLSVNGETRSGTDNPRTEIMKLEEALRSDKQIERRRAVRELIWMGAEGEKSLNAALDSDDVIVRRAAIQVLAEKGSPEKRIAVMKKALSDASPAVRIFAVDTIVFSNPKFPGSEELLKIASRDKVQGIAALARKALFPFHRDSILFRDRPDVKDHVESIKSAGKIEIPNTGWKIATDSDETGHLKKWFSPNFNDKAWKTIEVGKFWDASGMKYCGVAWYRGTFKAPPEIDATAAELIFGAVDETAWVWLNGQYAGQHDLGPAGWNQSFALDISGMIKWGAENQLTVRVLNTAQAGGIWKPLCVELLKLQY